MPQPTPGKQDPIMLDWLQRQGRVLRTTTPTGPFECGVCGRTDLPADQLAGELPAGDPPEKLVPVCTTCYLSEFPELYHRHYEKPEAHPGDPDLLRR